MRTDTGCSETPASTWLSFLLVLVISNAARLLLRSLSFKILLRQKEGDAGDLAPASSNPFYSNLISLLTSPLTGPPFACSAPGFTTAIKALLPVSNPLFSAAWSVHQPPARWSTRTLFRVGIMYKSFLARFAYFVKNRGRGSCQYIFLKVCTAGQPPYWNWAHILL